MDILDTRRRDNGLIERRFVVQGTSDAIPGLLWTPANVSGPVPLILVGHGGGGSKVSPTQVMPARDYFTAAVGIAAVAAIDAPQHGDRGPIQNIREPEFAELYRRVGAFIDQAVSDWRATLDALLDLGEFDEHAVAYSGMSLGSVIGIPFVAAEPRIAVALLGLMGLRGSVGTIAAEDIERQGARLATDAPKVTCPLMFHVQWDDDIIEHDSAFELFGLLGSTDKRLQVTPGPHGVPQGEARDTVRTFLTTRLAALHAGAGAGR